MNNVTRLGYDPKAPLPTLLPIEEIYGTPIALDPEVFKHDRTGSLEAICSFYNDVTNRASDHCPKTIDEDTFVKCWLPHFYSDDDSSSYSITHAWINEIAGSVHDGVDVTRNGEIIYRVPPILNQLKIMSGTERAVSMSMLLENYKQTVSRVPQSKEVQLDYLVDQIFIDNQGNRRDEFMSDTNLKYLFVLDEIFTYYGYKTILTPSIMLIKKQVMGELYNEYYSGGIVPSTKEQPTRAEPQMELDDEEFFADIQD